MIWERAYLARGYQGPAKGLVKGKAREIVTLLRLGEGGLSLIDDQTDQLA